MSAWSGPSGWLNPAVKPLPYDPAQGQPDPRLARLQARPGRDPRRPGHRPAQYAQPAHEMSYDVIVPDDLDFNGDRQFQILATAYEKIGVKLNEVSGGDGSPGLHDDHRARREVPHGRHVHVVLASLHRPELQPLGRHQGAVGQQQRHRLRRPASTTLVDASRARSSTSSSARRSCGRWRPTWPSKRPYIQLVNTDLITAHATRWTGFQPELWAYCKCYYTDPHPS